MSDADRPADVREEAAQMAIAEALEAWEEEHGFWPSARQSGLIALAALSAAGLEIVPTAERRKEWGTRRPDGSAVSWLVCRGLVAEARERFGDELADRAIDSARFYGIDCMIPEGA